MNAAPIPTAQAARYGLMGLPLAFVALPLYVLLPNHYARNFGLSLTTLGTLLLATRLLDAVLDPALGRLSDHLLRRSTQALLGAAGGACLLMALGFAALFFPPVSAQQLLPWAAFSLVLTYSAFSLVSLSHQSWGALLGAKPLVQSRLLAWREGLGLIGVLLASVVPVSLGLASMVALFAFLLVLGWLAWSRGPQPAASQTGSVAATALSGSAPQSWTGSLGAPWRQGAFRRLLLVYLLNGIASAIPATLVLFFVQDRLQAAPAYEPVFLGGYFLAAALSMPLWLALLRRWGLARAWLGGMALAMAVFAWAALLGQGDIWPFVLICLLSGVALGADLVLPSALLASTIERAGDLGRAQGAYYGWWAFVSKLNLALAAGLALPLLAWWGYTPGTRAEPGLWALSVAYCLLPCLLKLLAAVLLYRFFLRRGEP